MYVCISLCTYLHVCIYIYIYVFIHIQFMSNFSGTVCIYTFLDMLICSKCMIQGYLSEHCRLGSKPRLCFFL